MNHPKTKKLMEAVAFSALVTIFLLMATVGIFLICYHQPDMGIGVFIVLIFLWIAWVRYTFGGK